MSHRQPLLDPQNVARPQQDEWSRNHTAGVMFVAGIVFLVGTSIDFFVLWVLQRGSGLQWQFVASSQTAEGVPRLILGLGLLYLALHLRRSTSVGGHRILGVICLLVGIGSIALAVVIGETYSTMVGSVAPEALVAFRSTALKAGGLAVLYVLTLVPLGIAGLRAAPKVAR